MSRLYSIFCLFCMVQVVCADKIALKDGGKLEGKVVAETETTLTLEVQIGGKPVKVTVARDRIEKHEKSLTQAEEYEALVKKTDAKNADALVSLAQWCIDHKMKAEAAEHLKQALLANPKHTAAESSLKSLGYVKVGEMWMTEEEYREYQGKSKSVEDPAAAPKAVDPGAAKVSAAEAERKKQLEGILSHLEIAERKAGTTKKDLAEVKRKLDESQAKLPTVQKRIKELTSQLQMTGPSRRDNDDATKAHIRSMEKELSRLDTEQTTLEYFIREYKSAQERLETLLNSQMAEVNRLRERKEEIEKESQAASSSPAPAANVQVPAAPAPVAGAPAPVPGTPAPVPASPADPAPATPANAPTNVTPAVYSAMLDAKAASEFVPWLKKQVRFRNSSYKDVCKYMEGQLTRWAVMSREIGQRASENPVINYDVSKRLVVLEAKVLFTNKAGGVLLDAWLEDSEKRRHPHPNALYADHWRRMYQYNYSEVDRYFVEPLTGSTMRKNIILAGGYGSTHQTGLTIRGGQELCAGLGFFVPEGARSLVLNISSSVNVEKTVFGGTGGTVVERTEETIQLKVGDVPTGP